MAEIPLTADPVDPLPTLEQTEAALAAISPHRDPQAATILRDLAEAIIRVVCEHDQRAAVSRYFTALQISCKGFGNFQLAIHDKNAGIDPDALAHELAEKLRDDTLANYGKLQRPVQLDFGGDDHGG